jgi:flagellar export protein FliJ
VRRFRFPLEGLLRVRRVRERQARRELADALRSLREAEARCEAIRATVREAEAAVVQSQAAAELRAWAEVLDARRRDLHVAEEDRAQRAQRADELWARFLQARRERKAVSQVRSRRWRQYQQELARRQQTEADDLALLRRGRRS